MRPRANRAKSKAKVTKLIPGLHVRGRSHVGGGGLQTSTFHLKVSVEYRTTTSAAERKGKRTGDPKKPSGGYGRGDSAA